MKQRFSSYPIGELLIHTFVDSGLSLPAFMNALGYGNSHKGIATFDHWLKNGSGNQLFLERLTRSAYAPPPEVLRDALAATKGILDLERKTELARKVEEERQSFRPFVQGVAELTRPTSITMFALTGGPKRYTVSLPEDISQWEPAEREQLIKDTIVQNYAANAGRTLFMGKLTSYLFFGEYGERPTRYSIEGIRVGVVDGRPAGEAVLTVNGRPIPLGILAVHSMEP